MEIEARNIIEFNYKPSFYLNQTPGSAYLFYDPKSGEITVLDAEFNQIGNFNVDFEIKIPCSVHPDKACLSVINEKQALYIYDFKGNKIKEFTGDYACAAFHANGNLWTFERISSTQLKWIVYNTDWKEMATLDVEDPLYESHLFLTTVPRSNDMILELAAGQDGSGIYLLSNKDGSLSIQDLFPGECLTNPIFNEEGTRFLTMEFYEGLLYHYSYPELENLGEYEYDEEAEFGGTILYLDSKTAVISYDSRYFLLDIASKEMKIKEEILIKDHEPEPTEKFYPRLTGDTSLMTDISYMQEVKKNILANVDFNPNNNIVLVFEKNDFIINQSIRNANYTKNIKRQ